MPLAEVLLRVRVTTPCGVAPGFHRVPYDCSRCACVGTPALVPLADRASRWPRPVPRERMLDWYDHRCAQCDWDYADDGLEIDHYVPLSRGGENQITNLWVLCYDCNRRKWFHTPDELADLGGPWRIPRRLRSLRPRNWPTLADLP